jgi:hypothetical protein
VHVHVFVHVSLCVSVCPHVFMCVCVCVCVCVRACLYTCVRRHTARTRTHVCTCARVSCSAPGLLQLALQRRLPRRPRSQPLVRRAPQNDELPLALPQQCARRLQLPARRRQRRGRVGGGSARGGGALAPGLGLGLLEAGLRRRRAGAASKGGPCLGCSSSQLKFSEQHSCP